MRNLLYVIVVLLIIIWAIIFLSFNATGLVHALLVLALVVLLIRVFLKKKLPNE